MATVGDLAVGDLTPQPAQLYNWINGGTAASMTSNPTANAAGDYWLPIWSGEVLHAYDQYNIFEPMVTTETIESGTTKRFPVTGTVGHKGVWLAGQELVGDSGVSTPGFFDISLDQRPMAAFFEMDDIHLMLTQWDYRSELARQAGLQLSYTRDKQIACMIAKAAFTAARSPLAGLSGMNTGTVVLAPNGVFNLLGQRGATQTQRTDAALLVLEYIERYMVRLSEIDATLGEVYCAVTPQAFHDIRALGIARDATGLVGGAGRPFFGGVSEAGGLGAGLNTSKFALTDTLDYMGVKIVKSNHLAQLEHAQVAGDLGVGGANVAASGYNTATGEFSGSDTVPVIKDLGDTKYDFNWHQYSSGGTGVAAGTGVVSTSSILNPVKALIWQKSAVCSMRLQGMKVETVKDVRRGTFFTVASIMAGAGILRPELCGAIQGTYTAPA
jgi:hypothetical protein